MKDSDLCEEHSPVDWPVLEGVPSNEVRRLLQVARRRTFRRGEIVFHQDDPADSLHLVASGRFAIHVRTPRGELATVAIVVPGHVFGEIASLQRNPRRTATVEALEEAETLCVYDFEFERLRHENPEVTEALLRLLAADVCAMNERLLEAFYVPAERRVLRRVSELAEVYSDDEHGTITIPLKQEFLAGMAGTSRATVNAALRDAKDRGLVELVRGGVRVVDTDGLATRAR
jgi:CRP-like cAMP-binding protein